MPSGEVAYWVHCELLLWKNFIRSFAWVSRICVSPATSYGSIDYSLDMEVFLARGCHQIPGGILLPGIFLQSGRPTRYNAIDRGTL